MLPSPCPLSSKRAAMLFVYSVHNVCTTLNRFQPDSCDDPVCDNDIDLCPGRVVCEPIPPGWFQWLEMACVIVFTLDYLVRVGTCAFVPARYFLY